MDWKKLKSNSEYWGVFREREKAIDRIRQFFKKEGFLEVQTPLLVPSLIPESYLEVFETELRDKLGKKSKAFLTTSPEMWHKKLLVAGSGNIFEITKSFRNTDVGGHFHNPEFTLLEWYRIEADYKRTMEDCEELIRFVNGGKSKITYQGKTLDIGRPFERISVIGAFEKYAHIGDEVLFDEGKLRSKVLKRGYQIDESDDWEMIYNLVYLKEIEPNFGWGRPTIVYDFPAQFAPLAKTSLKDSRLKERFELYMFGIELADAYNELTNPVEQREQFEKEIKLRRKLGRARVEPDWDFIKALEKGLPDCSGVALGVDRLMMILADKTDIGDVVLFAGEEIF